jgi:hypothetical protein
MKKLWIFIGDKQFWRGLEKDKYFKIKPSWDEDWGAKLAGKIGIYDPFFGYRVDEQTLFCSGIIMTEPYITPDGWTLELFPKNSFEKPVETKKLFASFNKPVPEDKRFCVFSLDESEVEALCSCLKDRKLQEEFESLSRLGKMELGWEMMKSLFAECIARGFAVRGYKVIAEVLYKDKGGGSLDLLITDEKKQGENNKYYALELKIEKDKDTCGSSIRDIIFDAYRLVIDKENNYRKKIQDSQKYTVLLIDPKYIGERSGYRETLLKSLINKNEDEEVDFNKISKKIEEIVSKKSNNRIKNRKDEDKENNDTEEWIDCSKKIKEIKLTIKRKIKIDDSNNNKIEIILFKCLKHGF